MNLNRHGHLDFSGLPTCSVNRIQARPKRKGARQLGSSVVGYCHFWAHIVFGHIYADRPFATSSDASARTITVSGASLNLNAQSAKNFDEAFAQGKEVFKAGEALGTLSFTAQAQ